jgi:hypothetical protein
LVLVEHGRNIRVVDWSAYVSTGAGANAATSPATSPTTTPGDDWENLFAAAPAQSYAALFRLMKQPDRLIDRSIEIEKRFGSGSEYGQWIAELSSPQSEQREKAHHALERAGNKAATAIRHALANAPPGEARDRLQALSDLLRDAAPTTESEAPPVLESGTVRYLEALGWLDLPRARDALDRLSRSSDIDIASFARIAAAHQSAD